MDPSIRPIPTPFHAVAAAGFLLYLGLLLGPAVASANAVLRGKIQLPESPRRSVPLHRYEAGPVKPSSFPEPRAVVYLKSDTPIKRPERNNKTRVMAQVNLQFRPPVLPVQVGTSVVFPNRDNQYHNVFSYSAAKRFDLGRYLKTEDPPTRTFDQPGLIKLYCDIHDWMRASILVLKTPYFTTTDPEGRFRITGVPAGEYTLHVWFEGKSRVNRTVVLKDQKTYEVSFDLTGEQDR